MPATLAGPSLIGQSLPRNNGRSLQIAPKFPLVAIGASAGGLEACRKLFDGLPAKPPMAFILVQHLDPTHESMMVDLLSAHTAMPISQAEDGGTIEPGNVYVIPPGAYLSVADGRLVVSKPQARHGARLPFDFLLNALADQRGSSTICVVLSGSGDDGSAGLKAVKAAGGSVIVQDPEEAAFDGMPRSAMLTGRVDQVLPIARIPGAILAEGARIATSGAAGNDSNGEGSGGTLAGIVDLVRQADGQDFRLYKPGTLRRRVQRRMAMAAVPVGDMGAYLERLRGNPEELAALAKDLLIHVTSFFRDPKVFEALADTIAPEMVRARPAGDSIRIWVPGCSTGEEAYSLAMVFREEIARAGAEVKLQVFASDMDPDAVTAAREGFYPATIADHVSPARLARFFSREEQGYRISPELRATVVFTTQNILEDPPFSRLDLISCRNLLIYLRPEAQAKLVSIFHFALKMEGVLLLGGSETVGAPDERFEIISKPRRLYRRVGRARPGDLSFVTGSATFARGLRRRGTASPANGPPSLAELCRRLVLEAHAPAAVLINRARECLYSLGPTDRYLKMAAGTPSFDLLAMARNGVRAKLASAIAQAFDRNVTVSTAGGPLRRDGAVHAFRIEARPVQVGGEGLLLVCFLDAPVTGRRPEARGSGAEVARVSELEAELDATKAELQSVVRNLEISIEEQTTTTEEALSVNEEYQSTNEELLTSKEELQSLNEELTALNSQLQETLDRQRTTAADLQNILYSTHVATIFLDEALRIRFFTPATRTLFSIIPTDIGRPLADLRALAHDGDLLADARAMLRQTEPLEREIEGADGDWYLRRIMPYRAQGDVVEGVVITYLDITERRETSKRLEAATLAAGSANQAKSRFLAAASHDLRQPLQTLTLIQGLLARKTQGEAELKLIAMQEQCVSAMSGMLNTLLDINQIDAGVVRPNKVDFPVQRVFDQLKDEFGHNAQASGLRLRIASCGLNINSDPALLEQMIRNLIANAVKYTAKGKILVGCRRHGKGLQIQVLDTGVGIPAADLDLIFEEYHQIENNARERSRGLGLGLSIVKRLGVLLDHKVGVRSRPGRGSVFTIDVDQATARLAAPEIPRLTADSSKAPSPGPTGSILVVEDDPEVRELLKLLLEDEGHLVTTAPDGPAALTLLEDRADYPDLFLADFNLPGGLTGLEFATRARARCGPERPVIILTGDISTDTLREIGQQRCVPLHKPVKPVVLESIIQGLLLELRAARPSASSPAPTIYLVDDDSAIRDTVGLVLAAEGLMVRAYADGASFLADYRPQGEACLLIDAYLPGGMSGLELLERLRGLGETLPAIMITGQADVKIAVQAMKAGAADFIEKPIAGPDLVASINRVLEGSRDSGKLAAARTGAAAQIAKLTLRQGDILKRVLAGHPSKNIAADLGISQRTVENHRAAIMRRTGTKSLPALARLALAAAEATGAPKPTA
jgi:two-component system CheB/CheR fusion protein